MVNLAWVPDFAYICESKTFANLFSRYIMKEYRTCIRFDWAAKRLLRDKANFVVLEGLVSVLLNKTSRFRKYLRVKETPPRRIPNSTASTSWPKTTRGN